MEYVGVIIGAIIGIVSGIIVAYSAKIFEERSNKKFISRALLSEVKSNQSRLQFAAKWGTNFRKFVEDPNSFSEESRKNFENKITADMYHIDIGRELSFDRTIYSASSDKIGLLNPEIRDKIVQYYVGLKLMEDISKYISEISLSTDKNFDPRMKPIIKGSKTKEYFEQAEECFSTGEELLGRLKE